MQSVNNILQPSITRARDRSRTGLGYGKPSVVQVFVDLSGRRPQGLIDSLSSNETGRIRSGESLAATLPAKQALRDASKVP